MIFKLGQRYLWLKRDPKFTAVFEIMDLFNPYHATGKCILTFSKGNEIGSILGFDTYAVPDLILLSNQNRISE